MSLLEPLILTLQLDTHSAQYFDDLRQRHFPANLNFLSAHVTLFHHLPGKEAPTLAASLERAVDKHGPIDVQVKGLRFLGRGVAYTLQSAPLTVLRARLAEEWRPWLTPQDRQRFQPHITVQNKVHPEEARRTLALLSAAPAPHTVSGVGLKLWRYLGGPWEQVREFHF